MTEETPTLNLPPLRLIPFGQQHLSDQYLGWLNNVNLMKYSEQRHLTHTLASCQDYVDSTNASKNHLWAIEITDESNSHIGNVSASLDRKNGLADIGLLIGASECQGKGFGLRAWQGVLDWLKTDVSIHKITGGCLAPNSAMLRIMQRANMLPDGCRPGHYIVDKTFVDIMYFAWRRPVPL